MAASASDKIIVIGRISGVFGVKGWVKVYSHTRPRQQLVSYRPWFLRRKRGEWKEAEVTEGRPQGKTLVAHLKGCDTPEGAQQYLGMEIGVRREQLPPPAPGEFYWVDLEGLQVLTTDGVDLGRVDHLLETGANDVLVVKGERERLIPLVMDEYVKAVDLAAGTIEVDWDPEF